MLIERGLGSEERVQRVPEHSMGFDVLHCDNRFGNAEIPIVVLGFDKVLSRAEKSKNQQSIHS